MRQMLCPLVVRCCWERHVCTSVVAAQRPRRPFRPLRARTVQPELTSAHIDCACSLRAVPLYHLLTTHCQYTYMYAR